MKAILCACLAVLLLAAGCSRTPQEKASRFIASGKSYMERKDYARAALSFRNAHALLPNDAEIEYQLGLAYLADGKLTDAVVALSDATKLNPKHAKALVQLAEIMARSGIPSVVQDSQRRMQDVLAASPGNLGALNALAEAELALGKPGDAERHLEEALQKFPKNLDSSVRLARVKLTQKDPDAAEAVLKQTLAAKPTSVPANIALGSFYMTLGRWAQAELQFNNAFKLAPTDPAVLLELAAAQINLREFDRAERTYLQISRLPEQPYRHLHAAYLFSRGEREPAIREFEQLVKSDPADRENRTRLISAYMVTGRVSDAEKLLAVALKKNPHDVDALLYRSSIFLRSGDDLKAEADLNEVLHNDATSAKAHYFLAQVFQIRGNTRQAQAELTIALSHDPNLLAGRIQLAQLMTLSNSAQTALTLLDAAPANQKQSLGIIIERNLAKLRLGDTEGFRAGVREGLKQESAPDLLVQDAVGKILDRNYTGARSSLQAALRQQPLNGQAVRAMVMSYVAEKQSNAATQFLQQYAGEHPDSEPLQEYLGEWLWNAGDHAGARKAFLIAKHLAPQNAAPDLALARADLQEGNLAAARTTLSGVLQRDSRNLTAHVLLASLEMRGGNHPAAIAEYRNALALNQNNPIILNNLAYLLSESSDQPDEALSFSQKAVEALPGSPDAAGTLGWILYRKGLYRNALPYLQKAVSDDEGSRDANAVVRQYHLAMTYLKLGDRKKGLQVLTRALQSNPKLPEAPVAQAVLGETAKSF